MRSHLKPVRFHRGGLFFDCRRTTAATLLIALAPLAIPGFAEQGSHSSPWKDPSSGLTWTPADNGSGISLHQAMRYCSELKSSGYADWRLPSIDELQGLFGGSGNESGRHIKGPIRITGWEWSSTPGQQDGEGWAFDFGDGGRASVAAGDSGLNRTLCVRGRRYVTGRTSVSSRKCLLLGRHAGSFRCLSLSKGEAQLEVGY